MTDKMIPSIDAIASNPNFKESGFHVDIRDNGTIVLQTKNCEGEFARKISVDDSEQILKLLRIILSENENS